MDTISNKQQKIIEQLGLKKNISSNWYNWRWQIKHTIRDIDTVEQLLNIQFKKNEKEHIKKTLEHFPLAITPYYLSLIDQNDYKNDPIFIQSVANPKELIISKYDMKDPLHEDKDSPAPGITHRYPDRVLFHISNVCAMYCRHCTRKRKVGDIDYIPEKKQIQQGLDYIKKTPAIRDVLLSGGDPLMLPDEYLDWVLTELNNIKHIEIIRIGSRIPVVMPYRVTDELCAILKKHHPLWLNTHFNHPREITTSSRSALKKLADSGIPLGNQTVLLSGVNDCTKIIKKLVHKLVANRVRPYYLYQCDLSEGLTHFRTPVGKGIEIIESLIGHTTGFAVPTYVIDAPGGGGKIPVMPNYLISWSTNKVVLRNYEGVITTYKEPDSYEPIFCDRNCDECTLQLNTDDAREYAATGIEKILSDYDKQISLTPIGNKRINRRNS